MLIDARAEEDEEKVAGAKRLTQNEVVGLCIEILLAGYDTARNSLVFTAYLLALNPDKQDKLCAAIDEYLTNNEVSNTRVLLYY